MRLVLGRLLAFTLATPLVAFAQTAPEAAPAGPAPKAQPAVGADAETSPETKAGDRAARDTAARDTAAQDTAAQDTAAQDAAAQDSEGEGTSEQEAASQESEPPASAQAEPIPVAVPPPAEDDQGYSDGTEPLKETPEPESPFILGILWDMSLPLGSTRDCVDKYSVPGMSVDGRYRGFGNFGIGFTLAWHRMEEKSKETVSYRNATLTGTMAREVSSSPFTFKLSYALRDKQLPAIPYVGLGLGGTRVLRRLDVGIARFVDESWHFALVPELGAEIPAGPVLLLLGTRLNYAIKTKENPGQLYMNFSLGVGFD